MIKHLFSLVNIVVFVIVFPIELLVGMSAGDAFAGYFLVLCVFWPMFIFMIGSALINLVRKHL